MFAIGFSKYDLLLIRYRVECGNIVLGYIRYYLKEDKSPTTFTTREEAEKFLDLIKMTNVEFVNDSVKNSIVNGSNIDKSKLMIFDISEEKESKNMARTKEDVIKGLKICTCRDTAASNLCCDYCPYKVYSLGGDEFKGTNCDEELMKDALILLEGSFDNSK